MIGVLDVRYCLLVNLYLAYSSSLNDRNQAVFQDLKHRVCFMDSQVSEKKTLANMFCTSVSRTFYGKNVEVHKTIRSMQFFQGF